MKDQTVSQSQPVFAPESAITEAEPSVSGWQPPTTFPSPTTSIWAKWIGDRSVKARRRNPKRGRIGGARSVAMWKVKGDDTYLIELSAGEHVQRVRLSEDMLEAISDLHAQSRGEWRIAYRVRVSTTAAPSDTSGANDKVPGRTQ